MSQNPGRKRALTANDKVINKEMRSVLNWENKLLAQEQLSNTYLSFAPPLQATLLAKKKVKSSEVGVQLPFIPYTFERCYM